MKYKKFVPWCGDYITGRNYSSGLIKGKYMGYNNRGIICHEDTGKKRFLQFIIDPRGVEVPFSIFTSWNLYPVPPYKYKSQCGIYIFYNHKTKTPYIGQSKSLNKRREGFYNHHCKYSGEVMRQARIEFPDFINDWSYRVLQYCSEEELNQLERDWLIKAIVKFKKTYNQIT